MPKAFDSCVKGGGRVRTMSGPSKKFGLSSNEFVRVCFPKGGGEMVRGHTAKKAKAQAVRDGG